jgi:hypothetical protein
MNRLTRKAGADHQIRIAALAISLQWVTGHARPEEQQIVEVRDSPLRSEAAYVVQTLARGALDLGNHIPIKTRRFA